MFKPYRSYFIIVKKILIFINASVLTVLDYIRIVYHNDDSVSNNVRFIVKLEFYGKMNIKRRYAYKGISVTESRKHARGGKNLSKVS